MRARGSSRIVIHNFPGVSSTGLPSGPNACSMLRPSSLPAEASLESDCNLDPVFGPRAGATPSREEPGRRAALEFIVRLVGHPVPMQVAFIEGEAIVAFDLNGEEFAELKARHRSRPGLLSFSDGMTAVPRSGKSVVQHFSHRPGEAGTTEPETAHHIRAKRAVRDVAIARGWQAQIEARHPDGAWIADVLLTRDGRRVAFEVQWSPQTIGEYEARTSRYRESAVEVVWLAKYTHRTWYDIESAVSALPLRPDGVGTFTVRPLVAAVDACLAHLEAAIPIPADATSVLKESCYRCGKAFGYHDRQAPWVDKEPFTTEEATILGRWAATLKRVYSQTAGKEYLAWHCPHCRAMQGDFYLRGARYVIVDGRLVSDTRRTTLWRIVEARLADAND